MRKDSPTRRGLIPRGLMGPCSLGPICRSHVAGGSGSPEGSRDGRPWGGDGIGSVVVSSTVGSRRKWSRADEGTEVRRRKTEVGGGFPVSVAVGVGSAGRSCD